TSAPATHGPSMKSATAAGPALQRPLPRRDTDAVGKVRVGPTPQMNFPGLAGERNTVGLMSPSPEASVRGAGGPNSSGWLVIGMMVRVIKFQSCDTEMGMTG